MIKDILFKLIPASWLDDYARQRWIRPPDFTDLSLAFVDEHGHKWYEYPSSVSVPLARMAVQIQTEAYLTALISDEQMNETRDAVNKCLAHGDTIGAGALLSRFFDTRHEVVPMDILINLIALTLVRDDEQPHTFDQVTHTDKINYLKGAVLRGDGFFFLLTEVKRLSEAFKIGSAHWQTLATRFEEVAQIRKRERDYIISKLSENG